MGKPHETLDTLQQIRSKLDEARTLSRSLGTPEEPYDLEVSLDTMIMGIDAQIGAVRTLANRSWIGGFQVDRLVIAQFQRRSPLGISVNRGNLPSSAL